MFDDTSVRQEYLARDAGFPVWIVDSVLSINVFGQDMFGGRKEGGKFGLRPWRRGVEINGGGRLEQNTEMLSYARFTLSSYRSVFVFD